MTEGRNPRIRRVEEPVAPTALQFEIVLEAIEPRIWRRIRIPVDSTLWDLHIAIQDAMGWDDAHLHQFLVISALSEEPIAIGIPSEDDHRPVCAGWEIPVALAFRSPGDKVTYHYDFGDDWMHTVALEEIVTAGDAIQKPTCIAGARACPPEDCGGPHGYEELLRALADPGHENHRDMKEWVPRDFDPDRFDPKRVKFDDPEERLESLLGD